MTRLGVVFLALCFGFLLTACVQEQIVSPAPSPGMLLVHAVLNPSLREQTVLLERVLSGAVASRCGDTTVPFGSYQCNPEHGASVSIVAPDSSVWPAVEDFSTDALSLGTGVYRISLDRYHASVSPGGIYALHVRTASGEEISGVTTVPVVNGPGSFGHWNREISSGDTVQFSAPGEASGLRYQLHIVTPFNLVYNAFLEHPVTLTGMQQIGATEMFLPGFRSEISIVAVDSNYYRYYNSANNLFTGRGLASSVRGGIGLFGAVAIVDTESLTITGSTIDSRSGLYRLTSPLPGYTLPAEFYLFVYPFDEFTDTNALKFNVTGSYSAPENGGRTEGLTGVATATSVELTFSRNKIVNSAGGAFTGVWNGTSIVGVFAGSNTTVSYAKQ